MSDFEYWVYRGLIAVLLMIVGWVIKSFATKVTDKLDQLIEAMHALASKNIAHESQLKQISEQQADHSNRLNDHAARIRDVELKQAVHNYIDK